MLTLHYYTTGGSLDSPCLCLETKHTPRTIQIFDSSKIFRPRPRFAHNNRLFSTAARARAPSTQTSIGSLNPSPFPSREESRPGVPSIPVSSTPTPHQEQPRLLTAL